MEPEGRLLQVSPSGDVFTCPASSTPRNCAPSQISDSVKLPRPDAAPYPAAILEGRKVEELEVPEAGLVDDAAVHEIPALPSDAEVAAIAAEQEAGAAAEAEAAAAAEAEAADAAQSAENEKASAAEDSSKPAPDADEGKEG